MAKNKISKRVMIFEATAGGGHLSITTAIIQALEIHAPHIQVIRANIVPGFVDKLYQFTSRQFVQLYLLFYKATNSRKRTELASKINLALQKRKIKNLIAKHRPHLIVSNSPLAVHEIPQVLREFTAHIPYCVFVADPYTPHAFFFTTKTELTMVSTLAAYQQGLRHGILPSHLTITGHPIRQEFFQSPTNIESHRSKLQLDPKLFTILFGGSGDGAEKTLEILIHLGARPSQKLLRHLIRTKGSEMAEELKSLAREILTGESEVTHQQFIANSVVPFQALVVTGNNTQLQKQLSHLTFPPHITPHILGYTKNMADYIHASDLVAAKAGPNIILESVAAYKPFLATYHIHGQEDGNLDFIRSTQIGFVEEDPQKAAQLIEIILHHQEMLKNCEANIKFVRQHHQPAARTIAQELVKLLDTYARKA